ncbi:MAG: phosphonate ABC transporter ATP-binding protein [Deltaproteobacteria bacterium]|nr:phosphonate ABC transporter ATP-binding protein [Deltaproteobacteria bacterium]
MLSKVGVVTLLLACACASGDRRDASVDSSLSRDASTRDSGAMDSAADSGAPADSGFSLDAVTPDAVTPDAEPRDAANPDAGDVSGTDAEPLDAGFEDAAAEDSGSPVDVGPELVAVTLEVTVPPSTPAGNPVHVAGNFQGWNPADPAYALTAVSATVHTITLDFAVGQQLEFKFVRGDWSRVEKGPAGEEIANRALTVTSAGTHSYTVASWADSSSNPGTRTGNVSEVQVPGFLNGRRVWVYLPPGYSAQDPSVRYPVLYMLDGQNVFDANTSFSGEWEVDEALEALIPTGEVRPLVVIAVDNGGAARLDEYTPWQGDDLGQLVGGGGEAHLQAFRDVLLPWVDSTFNTLTGPENTGFSGSSLGGLMSVYAAYAHSDVFGRIGALSPSVWWANEMLVDFVAGLPKPPVVLWTDMGTAEGDLGPFQRLRAELLSDGFVEGQDLTAIEVAGAAHNEQAWAARMPDILRFLFPGP